MDSQTDEPVLPWTDRYAWHELAVGPGWYELVARLHADLVAIAPDYRVSQVKAKFGGLRYYLDTPSTAEMTELIREAEERSYTLCEECGAPSAAAASSSYGTRCDQHPAPS